MKCVKILSAMICVVLAAHPVCAEEKTVQMQEVVVTASKIPKTREM